jgi:choice-of-anchor C domain-containing protein
MLFLTLWDHDMKVGTTPIGLAMATLVLAAGQAQAGNLIINGDFSAPNAATAPNDGSVYKFVYAGDPSLTGWTVASGSVETDLTAVTFGTPTASGNPQNLDLDGNSAGTITQSFATTVGKTYSLDFYYSDNPYGPGAAATVSVSDSSLIPLLITHSDATYGSLNWQYVHESFVATSTSATLAFTSNDSPSNTTGILLDNVSVASVPEPSSITQLGLGGIGLALIVGWRRFRRTR